MKIKRLGIFFLLFIPIFTFAAQNILNESVEFYNKNRTNLPSFIKQISGRLTSADEKYLEKVTSNLKVIPPAKMDGDKAILSSNGRTVQIEILDNDKFLYLINGHKYKDRVLGPMEARHKMIMSILNEGKVSLFDGIFESRAVAGVVDSISAVATSLFFGGSAVKRFGGDPDFCTGVQDYYNKMKDVTDYTIVQSKYLRLKAWSVRREISAYIEECQNNANLDFNHCVEVTQKMECGATEIGRLLDRLKEVKENAKKSGKELHFYWAEGFETLNENLESYKKTAKLYLEKTGDKLKLETDNSAK